MNVEGVPAKAPRAAVVEFLRSLGIESDLVRGMSLSQNSIEVRVLALGENGRPYASYAPDGETAVAEHSISIQLV